MKKYYYLLVIISLFFVGTVSASNDVSYKLTITKNYDFNEEINYSLTDYKQINNGDNYFSRIISDPVYTDIEYKIPYKKTGSKRNGKYYLKLSHTFTEFSLGNSNFLNNCFEESNYDYDVDTMSFTASDFNCLNGDSLRITLVTDFEVTETNATVSGNTYTWTPTNNNFSMNIKLNKTYEQKPESNAVDNDHIGMNDEQNTSADTQENEETDTVEKTSINWTVVLIVIGSIILLGVIALIKKKKKSVNANKL